MITLLNLIKPYAITCCATIVIAAILAAFVYHASVLTAIRDWSYASLYGFGNNYIKPFKIIQIGAIWFLWATFWSCLILNFACKSKYKSIILFASIVFGMLTKKYIWMPFSIQAGMVGIGYMYLGHIFRKVNWLNDAFGN